MKYISIIGATLYGNQGAEAMLSATIQRIKEKYPDIFFFIFSYYPINDKKIIKESNVKIFSSTPLYLLLILYPLSLLYCIIGFLKLSFLKNIFPDSIKSLANSNLLIDLAGVSFIDSRKKYLPFNILTIWPAILLKVPVIKFSQAMGPFKTKINYWCAKYFLAKCDKIFARGKATFQNLIDLDMEASKIELGSDIAFLYKANDSLNNEIDTEYLSEILEEIKIIKNSNKKVIGICPSSLLAQISKKQNYDYVHYLLDVIKKLIELKYFIVFFPNATREQHINKLRNNDLPVIKAIINKLENKKDIDIIGIEKNINTEYVKRIISMCDLTIVSRFHAMVASLEAGTPVFVYGWGHKYFEVMKQFEQEEWVCSHKTRETMLDKIIDLEKKVEEEKIKINNNIKRVQLESQKQLDYIFLKIK